MSQLKQSVSPPLLLPCGQPRPSAGWRMLTPLVRATFSPQSTDSDANLLQGHTQKWCFTSSLGVPYPVRSTHKIHQHSWGQATPTVHSL